VGFGMEILFVLILGLLLLGPKRLHTMLAHVARAKAELENATRGLKSQLAAELEAMTGADKNDCSHVLLGDCELCSTPKSAPEQNGRR
jgi:Sec-independent protein translocase protein TatA